MAAVDSAFPGYPCTVTTDRDPTSRAFFEAMYDAATDPWNFAGEPYELARYHDIVAELGDDTYASGFEPGCSVGVLTEMLAPRCKRLLATDISSIASERAAQRCTRFDHVEVRQGRLPDDVPRHGVDLVVLSEIGYYFTPEALAAAIDAIVDVLVDDGLLVAAHWTGHSDDHVITGDAVHQVLAAVPGLRCAGSQKRPGYNLDRYRRIR